jgi:predicted molibdopterin-dependent oxidoreductase YjgC
MAPDPRREIHPGKTVRYVVPDGEWVDLRTGAGSVRLKARHNERIREDTVHIPQGWEEANPNVLTGMSGADPISGFPNLKSVHCRLKVVEIACTAS